MKKTLFMCVLLPLIANAQMSFTGGPNNLTATCQAVWASGDTAYVGYNKGLYRTFDGGQNWDFLTNGIPYDCDPRVIEFSDGKLFVATNDDSRMYTSTDYGDLFVVEAGNLALLSPRAGTAASGIVMIGGTTVPPSKYNSATSSWDPVVSGSVTHDIQHLGGDTLWLCSGTVSSGTTQYSHDNGQTWTPVANEPNTDMGGGIIWNALSMAIAKVGSRIIVGTNLNNFPILYTDDYGVTWTAASASGYGCSQLLVVNQNLILANINGSIHQSTDQGETWSYLIPAKGPMAIWKDDNLLTGMYEYDNYGSGSLIQQHSVPASASRLVPFGNELLSAANGIIMSFNPTSYTWSVFQDMNSFGVPLNAKTVHYHNNNLYALIQNGTSESTSWSTDDGLTFTNYDLSSLVGQSKLSFINQVAGKDFIGSYEFPSNQPRISYSTDGGASYTNATFSNTISYGLYGLNANYCENILDAGSNVLVADFNAGYAISSDGGLNWTFYGGAWDQSYMSVSGGTIFHFNQNGGTKTLKQSVDGGASWQNISLAGLPNSGGAGYNGYFGVWNLNGKICTYNAFEAPRGVYELNEGTFTWSLLSNSECPFLDWDGVTELSFHDGNYYASWFLNGVYSSALSPNAAFEVIQKEFISVYPNPAEDIIHITVPEAMTLKLTDLFGKVLKEVKVTETTLIDLSDYPSGMYFLVSSDFQTASKILKK